MKSLSLFLWIFGMEKGKKKKKENHNKKVCFSLLMEGLVAWFYKDQGDVKLSFPLSQDAPLSRCSVRSEEEADAARAEETIMSHGWAWLLPAPVHTHQGPIKSYCPP